jgi:hypothetical protein
MRKFYLFLLSVMYMIGGSFSAIAQCEPTFRPDTTQFVYNGAVNASTRSGNTLFVGGAFTMVGKYTGGFARVNVNTGSVAGMSQMPRVTGTVSAIVQDGSGGWYVAGTFTNINGEVRNNIAQINSAGQLTLWNPNANGAVHTMLVIGNTLYIGGAFTTISGQTRNRMAAYDMTTGNLLGWNPNVASGTVWTICEGGGYIYAGGSFTTVGGQARLNAVGINPASGTVMPWNPGTNAGGIIYKMVSDGTVVYVGGSFTTVAGAARTNAAAISIATSTTNNWSPNPNGIVRDILLNGSTIYIAGNFTTAGSLSRRAVAEVDATIGNATSFTLAINAGGLATAIKKIGSTIYVGGTIVVTATTQANLLKANATTGSIQTWDANANGNVNVLEVVGDNLYAGGAMTAISKRRDRLAAIDIIGDTVLPWRCDANSNVYALVNDGTNVYAGGLFTTIGGVSRQRLAAIDIASAGVTSWIASANGTVTALALQGTSLYASGSFSSINSTTRNFLAQISTVNAAVGTMNLSLNGSVNAIFISGGNLYIGGNFTSSGSQVRNRIASATLATGNLTSWNPGADGTVTTFAAKDNFIYAGGSFTNIGGQLRPRLAALDVTSGLASAWTPYPNNPVNSLAIDASKIYVGGAFTNIGGQLRDNLAAVDLGTGLATAWNPDPSAIINHIAIYDGRMLAGGAYANMGGNVIYNFGAQLNILETAPVINISGRSVICAASSQTYTAITPVVGGTYQWRVNNADVVGATNATYTYTPANNDQIACVITVPPASSCYTRAKDTSDHITVTTTPPATPVVSIAGNTTVCFGTNTTYTATVLNVINPTYQWTVNNIAAGTNAPTLAYTPANGDAVKCTITVPQNGCFTSQTAASNTLIVTVNAPVLPSASIIATSNNICPGSLDTFAVTTNVVNGTYMWMINGFPAGTNNDTLIYAPNNGEVIYCQVTVPADGCYLVGSVISNTVTMTVQTLAYIPNITVSPATYNMCAGTQMNFGATTNIINPIYAWYANSTQVGTGPSLTYTPQQGDVISCTVTVPPGQGCVSGRSANGIATQTGYTLKTNPAISVTHTPMKVCQGTSVDFTATTNVTDPVSYQWKVNGTNTGTNNNVFSYQPADNDIVLCYLTITPPVGCYTLPYAASMATIINVQPSIPANMVIAAMPFAEVGSTVTVNAILPAGIGNYSIEWKLNGNVMTTTTNVSTITYTKAAGNDVISAVLTSNDPCYIGGPSVQDANVNSVGTGVANVNNQSGITVYPNPFKDVVNVKGIAAGDKVTLYDMAGRVIAQYHNGGGQECQLLIKDVAQGAYMLRVVNSEGAVKTNQPLRKL